AGESVGIAPRDGGIAMRARAGDNSLRTGQNVRVMIRPQNLAIERGNANGSAVPGRVLDVMVSGSLTKIFIDAGASTNAPIVAAYPTRRDGDAFELGQPVALQWKEADAVVLAE